MNLLEIPKEAFFVMCCKLSHGTVYSIKQQTHNNSIITKLLNRSDTIHNNKSLGAGCQAILSSM